MTSRASRSKGAKIHGWLVLDKSIGISSNHALVQVRRRLNVAKLGHAGTLDPLASGILPIAFGEATKLLPLVVKGVKTYVFSVQFGEERSTDDAEGEVIASSDYLPTIAEIRAIIPQFIGTVWQTPPAFSAISVGGVRAYQAARAGVPIELAPRQVTIDRLTLIEFDGKTARFEMDCGSGTYVRSLARDLARQLGTFGFVSQLRRTRVGKFIESHSISLDNLELMVHSRGAISCVLPIMTLLDDIPAIAITADEAKSIHFGRLIKVTALRVITKNAEISNLEPVVALFDDLPIALGHYDGENFAPYRVFNLNQ